VPHALPQFSRGGFFPFLLFVLNVSLTAITRPLFPRELLTSGSSAVQSERRYAGGDSAESGEGAVVCGGCCERVT